MTRIGYPQPLYLLDLDGRDGGPAPAPAQRRVILDALTDTLRTGTFAAGDVGVLVDDAELAAEARERGSVRVVPADRAQGPTFELAHDDTFARHLEDTGADLAKVTVTWSAGMSPEDRKAQALQLTKLAAWLHETDRGLLVVLDVAATPSDLDQVDGDRVRFRNELQPELMRRGVQEIRDLGVEPDVWVIELTTTDEQPAELAGLAREAGRDDVALLVADGADDALLRTAAAATGYRGFVAGRSIWAAPLAALDEGASSRDETVRAIADRLGRRLDVFRSTPGV